MTIEKKPTPAWDSEQELEYQIGDMNGIAFETTDGSTNKEKKEKEEKNENKK